VQLAEGFVLHQRPFRDTGRLVEVFTRDHGRLSLFARGARGPKSRLAPVLQPFRRLLLSFTLGRGDAGQLTGAEWASVPASGPAADRLMSCWYLNELLLKLTGRLDAQPAVYDAYAEALAQMTRGDVQAAVLRSFEYQLLVALGYGIDAGDLDPQAGYRFDAGQGFSISRQPDALPGRALLGMAQGDWADPVVQAVAAQVLRPALELCLEGRELRTRAVARAVMRRAVR
jgi:DNA repair protein RecO (recombination protein O)